MTSMEKTFSKIKTLKSRRKLSLPAAASPPLVHSSPRGPRRVSDDVFDPEEQSPPPATSRRAPQRRVAWSPAARRPRAPTPASEDEEDEEEGEEDGHDDSPTDLTHNDKLKAMRKSLRSRSVCSNGGSSASAAGGSPNYSLLAGLKGVNSIVSVTGSHISGRRLSTPAGRVQQVASSSSSEARKVTQRSKRSESATTVEEEALKLRAYMASRHGSLPAVVVVNADRNYLYATKSRCRIIPN